MARLAPKVLARRRDQVISFLRDAGLLLQADAELASIATIVAGEPITGSWWSHPRAHDIYDVCVALEDEDDILELKLVKGKVTHVHAVLWPALLNVAMAGEAWNREGALRSDEYRNSLDEPRRLGPAIRQLEQRLLIVTTEFHTEQGSHAKLLETWPHWVSRLGKKPATIPVSSAKSQLLEAVARLGTTEPERFVSFSI